MNEVCDWNYVDAWYAEYWKTSCGNEHQFVDGGPKENSYIFCPYCGKRIKENSNESVVDHN